MRLGAQREPLDAKFTQESSALQVTRNHPCTRHSKQLAVEVGRLMTAQQNKAKNSQRRNPASRPAYGPAFPAHSKHPSAHPAAYCPLPGTGTSSQGRWYPRQEGPYRL